MIENKSLNLLLFTAAIALFSQDAPVEGDHARRVWSTEFRESRADPAAPAVKPNAKPNVVGVTLWRLRAASVTDQARLIFHEEVSNEDKEFTLDRISPATRLQPNDRIRLSIESAQAGYLYVASQESYANGKLGQPHLIFPSRRMYGGSNRVEARRPLDIPELSNRKPYLTLKRSRPDHDAEVLTIWVTPAPLAGTMVQSQPVPIDPVEWDDLKKRYGTQVKRIETGASGAWTAAEMAASQGKQSLAPGDALPHTLFRAATSQGVLFTVPLSLGQ